MKLLSRMPLVQKLVLLSAFSAATALILTAIAFFVYEGSNFREAAEDRAFSLGQLIATSSASALEFDDPAAARQELSALRSIPEVRAAWLLKGSRVFASYRRDSNALYEAPPEITQRALYRDDRMYLNCSVQSGGEPIGSVILESDLTALADRRKQAAVILAGVLLASMLFAVALSTWLRRYISEPMRRLTRAVNDVARERDYSVRVKTEGNDETATLIAGFNGMLEQIESRDLSLRISEARARRMMDSDMLGMIFWEKTGRILEANGAFLKLLGYERQDLEAGSINWAAMTPTEYAHLDVNALRQMDERGICTAFEKEYIRKDGSRVPVVIGAALFLDTPNTGVAFVLDLSERHRLENQLNQAQKMESIGRLAGGVAHDFNNILTAVMGFTSLAQIQAKGNPELKGHLAQIMECSERAASLTQQLLAFARKQAVKPQVVNVHEHAKKLLPMLQRLMGEHIELSCPPPCDPGFIHIDPGQLEQLLINLTVNGRDAMPNGGELKIGVENVALTEQDLAGDTEALPGDYVQISIVDTGEGIDPEILEHIFEPFFTTKDKGKGTGLGLATCFGIVKQNKGRVTVASEPGKGTDFRVFLKRVEPPAELRVGTALVPPITPGKETILLAEDEESVRKVCSAALLQAGYSVIEAVNGEDALKAVVGRESSIQLLVTDSIMPKMGGRVLAERLQALNPSLRVLFMSGYTDDTVMTQRIHDAQVAFLQKPFSPAALTNKVRETLDRARKSG